MVGGVCAQGKVLVQGGCGGRRGALLLAAVVPAVAIGYRVEVVAVRDSAACRCGGGACRDGRLWWRTAAAAAASAAAAAAAASAVVAAAARLGVVVLVVGGRWWTACRGRRGRQRQCAVRACCRVPRCWWCVAVRFVSCCCCACGGGGAA
jgi:hypothetical protein